MDIEKSCLLYEKEKNSSSLCLSAPVSQRGQGWEYCVIHLLVPQVLVEFGAGEWRMLGNHPQGWPLALDLVGAWQAEPVWKSPGAVRKSPAAESPQGAAGQMEPQSGGPCRQPEPDFREMDSCSCQRGQAQTSPPGLCAHEMVWGPQALSKPLGMQIQGLGEL